MRLVRPQRRGIFWEQKNFLIPTGIQIGSVHHSVVTTLAELAHLTKKTDFVNIYIIFWFRSFIWKKEYLRADIFYFLANPLSCEREKIKLMAPHCLVCVYMYVCVCVSVRRAIFNFLINQIFNHVTDFLKKLLWTTRPCITLIFYTFQFPTPSNMNMANFRNARDTIDTHIWVLKLWILYKAIIL